MRLSSSSKANFPLARGVSSKVRRSQEGERVLLLANHIKLVSLAKQPTQKLQPRYIRLYVVSKVISPVAYKLELPKNLNIHPVFHIALLKRYIEPTSMSGRNPPIPPPDAVVTGE